MHERGADLGINENWGRGHFKRTKPSIQSEAIQTFFLHNKPSLKTARNAIN